MKYTWEEPMPWMEWDEMVKNKDTYAAWLRELDTGEPVAEPAPKLTLFQRIVAWMRKFI